MYPKLKIGTKVVFIDTLHGFYKIGDVVTITEVRDGGYIIDNKTSLLFGHEFWHEWFKPISEQERLNLLFL